MDPSDARREALLKLLTHDRVQDPEPRSDGGPEQKLRQFGSNVQHAGDPAFDTADFDDRPGEGPGNLRVDYVLPSRGLRVTGAAVFWPRAHEAAYARLSSSDHRLVWVDVAPR